MVYNQKCKYCANKTICNDDNFKMRCGFLFNQAMVMDLIIELNQWKESVENEDNCLMNKCLSDVESVQGDIKDIDKEIHLINTKIENLESK